MSKINESLMIMLKDTFQSPDKRTREELKAQGIVPRENDNRVLPYQLGVGTKETPRSMFVVYAQMEIQKKFLGVGIDVIGSTLKALGIRRPPNPTFHWGLRVGNFVHELDFIFYDNKEYDAELWKSYGPIGVTMKNNADIIAASVSFPFLGCSASRRPSSRRITVGVATIEAMDPVYNLWWNNCHSFVIGLLNRITCGDREKLCTGASLRIGVLNSQWMKALSKF